MKILEGQENNIAKMVEELSEEEILQFVQLKNKENQND